MTTRREKVLPKIKETKVILTTNSAPLRWRWAPSPTSPSSPSVHVVFAKHRQQQHKKYFEISKRHRIPTNPRIIDLSELWLSQFCSICLRRLRCFSIEQAPMNYIDTRSGLFSPVLRSNYSHSVMHDYCMYRPIWRHGPAILVCDGTTQVIVPRSKNVESNNDYKTESDS